MKLLDVRTSDGSRHFLCLPQNVTWRVLCRHLLRLEGTRIFNFVGCGMAAAWIDFGYRGNRFLVRNEGRDFSFFVRDPLCPDLTLFALALHCERLLGRIVGSE